MRARNAAGTRSANVSFAARAAGSSWASSPRVVRSASGFVIVWLNELLVELLDADVAEPDGLALRLQRDMSERQLQRGAGGQQPLRVFVARVELRALVSQHLGAIDPVDHFLVPVHLGFDAHPHVERIELRLRIDD